jgi:hypothetical protein
MNGNDPLGVHVGGEGVCVCVCVCVCLFVCLFVCVCVLFWFSATLLAAWALLFPPSGLSLLRSSSPICVDRCFCVGTDSGTCSNLTWCNRRPCCFGSSLDVVFAFSNVVLR